MRYKITECKNESTFEKNKSSKPKILLDIDDLIYNEQYEIFDAENYEITRSSKEHISS